MPRERKRNIYGVPIFDDRETALLHAELLKPPCPACGAAAGAQCTPIGEKFTVHMGRLPPGFHSESVVDALLEKLE